MTALFPIPEFERLAQKLLDSGYSAHLEFAKGDRSLVKMEVTEMEFTKGGCRVLRMYNLRQLEIIRLDATAWIDSEYTAIIRKFIPE